MNNARTCAKCGELYPEVHEPWPKYPACSLCQPTRADLEEAMAPQNLFNHYLQITLGHPVPIEVSNEILNVADNYIGGSKNGP